ncbi:RsfA family transcriptional regulator [Aquibacillus sediminis]|uniref:RsfA family transcriptional regulator n=1 Tax=Aquibacillus sediminis TaxID=2574734 RepID=UPI0011094AE1|nr:RsfA family transcriptional regulator [Aquibacillus sediminis]
MNNTRQDAWSQDEDILLAETVMRYIREGKTQLEAFKEVGKRLSRTPAACGFRWNASVRKKYEKAIELAKKDRKQQAESLEDILAVHQENQEGALDAAISLLEKMKVNYSTEQNNETAEEKIRLLTEEINELKQQLRKYEQAWHEILNICKTLEENKHDKVLSE